MAIRLDLFLAQAGIVPSRAKAKALIKEGAVVCNGRTVLKPSLLVEENSEVWIADNDTLKYVSRGGLKLAHAIRAFDLSFDQKTVLDIGSSTGGFTDCALQYGAKQVIAVDVGHNLMIPELAEDSRVELHEGTDIRNFSRNRFEKVDFVVCDVSFISILRIADYIHDAPGNFAFIGLIKPQFECGAVVAKKYNGVIKNSAIHCDILATTLLEMQKLGFYSYGLDPSPILGGSGNIEYVSLFRRSPPDRNEIDIRQIVNHAFEQYNTRR